MRLEIQKTKNNKYYWVVIDGNGRATAMGTKVYTRPEDAKKAFEKLDRLF